MSMYQVILLPILIKYFNKGLIHNIFRKERSGSDLQYQKEIIVFQKRNQHSADLELEKTNTN